MKRMKIVKRKRRNIHNKILLNSIEIKKADRMNQHQQTVLQNIRFIVCVYDK